MGSDGGLVDRNNFSGLKGILGGQAGGVVGYTLTSWDRKDILLLGLSLSILTYLKWLTISRLDVGGTSTDLSRFDGQYEVVYETTTAGVTIQPQLDINTVAAGGSCLTFRSRLFLAGPESAGAQPGLGCCRCARIYALSRASG